MSAVPAEPHSAVSACRTGHGALRNRIGDALVRPSRVELAELPRPAAGDGATTIGRRDMDNDQIEPLEHSGGEAHRARRA